MRHSFNISRKVLKLFLLGAAIHAGASANCLAAAEPPLTPASLAASPNLWPKVVVLKQSVSFPVTFNGQTSGSVKVPAGTAVNLTIIKGNQLIVQYMNGTQIVAAASTDLLERVNAQRARIAAPEPVNASVIADAKSAKSSQEKPGTSLETRSPSYFGAPAGKVTN